MAAVNHAPKLRWSALGLWLSTFPGQLSFAEYIGAEGAAFCTPAGTALLWMRQIQVFAFEHVLKSSMVCKNYSLFWREPTRGFGTRSLAFMFLVKGLKSSSSLVLCWGCFPFTEINQALLLISILGLCEILSNLKSEVYVFFQWSQAFIFISQGVWSDLYG